MVVEIDPTITMVDNVGGKCVRDDSGSDNEYNFNNVRGGKYNTE